LHAKIENVAKSCNITTLETAQNIELHVFWVFRKLLEAVKKVAKVAKTCPSNHTFTTVCKSKSFLLKKKQLYFRKTFVSQMFFEWNDFLFKKIWFSCRKHSLLFRKHSQQNKKKSPHFFRHGQRWSESLFLTPAPVPKKVTPAPAPEFIGNLHSDSCLHSESLKAESILQHEVK